MQDHGVVKVDLFAHVCPRRAVHRPPRNGGRRRAPTASTSRIPARTGSRRGSDRASSIPTSTATSAPLRVRRNSQSRRPPPGNRGPPFGGRRTWKAHPDARVRFVAQPVRILAVGAAAPALRLAAGDVGRGVGPAGRERPAGRLRARRRHPDAGRGGRARARWPPAASTPPGSTGCGGARAGRRSPKARATPCSPPRSGSRTSPAGSSRPGRRTRAWTRCSAACDAVGAGSARVALVVVSDALVPGLGTSFEARCGAGAAALVLADDGGTAAVTARVTRTQPLLDRYRGDGESATRDLYDPRLFREEMFLPVVREVGEHLAAFDVTAWSLPDPDGRLGGSVARMLGATNAVSPAVYAAVGDTGAAAALLGGIGALDAARGGRDRRHRKRAHHRSDRHRRRAGARRGRGRRRCSPVGQAATVRGGVAGPGPADAGRRDDPDGRPTRERAVRPRRGGDAPAPRRAVRRLRHDQHSPVDPSGVHRVRWNQARAGSRSPGGARCTRSS